MNADDARRHFVIAIYGVGNPAAGEIETALKATLGAVVPEGAPFEVHEFDWNTFAPQATRTADRVWEYGHFFSASFASAAWFRSSRPTLLQQVRFSVDATIHVLWAGVQAALVFAVIASALLHSLGAASSWLSTFVRSLTTSGVLPAGVGWRSSVLGTRLLELTVELLRYGGLTILALLVASLTFAALEGMTRRSSRSIVETLRRHAFLILLAPCALMSVALFRRKGGESPFGLLLSFHYWALMAAAVAAMFAMSMLLGGTVTAAAWILYQPAIAAAITLWILLVRLLRAKVGPRWLAGAKVLLDIGLYVGTPTYRVKVQKELDRVIADIDREGTAIWVVAHSLGSVIALDSLTNSTAWLPNDRVRLVTLGSPIRRFFFRFFPDAFFEPSSDAAAGTVAQRVGTFHWLNAFRRFDYIGKSLQFRRSGLDLPTKQFWPAHANYWGDARVARTVIAGWQRSAPAEANPAPRAIDVPSVTGTIPDGVLAGSRLIGIATIAALTISSVGGTAWLIFPGLSNMLVRPPAPIQTPVSTTARVRHDRGFNGEAARIHKFTFVFHDESTGKDQTRSSAVLGFFGLWSDPRFDYLALARFVREECKPERAARFYEFGWSVPCWRDNVPIVYARADPTQFRVVGYDYRPGFVVRGVRLVFVVWAGLMSIVLPVMAVPLVGFGLWKFFAGDKDSVEG